MLHWPLLTITGADCHVHWRTARLVPRKKRKVYAVRRVWTTELSWEALDKPEASRVVRVICTQQNLLGSRLHMSAVLTMLAI